MKNLIQEFTYQLSEALDIGHAFKLIFKSTDIRNVLITGMGGSGIGASVIKSLTFHQISIPITVCKGYDIPQFVSPHTLFIACSYSGNTEETLSTIKQAKIKQAKIICITSGGLMLQFARECKFSYIELPNGYSSPRALIGFMMMGILFSLYRANLIEPSFISETEIAIEHLNQSEKTIQTEARLIAKKLVGKLPFIYSDQHLTAIATRFQQQLNENSKQIAHVNTFPEMNHNEIVGWNFPKNIFNNVQVIYLCSDQDHERVGKRLEICRKIFEKSPHEVINIVTMGDSLLGQYLYLIHYIDWISYFLAFENGVDPVEIESIDYLKDELGKMI